MVIDVVLPAMLGPSEAISFRCLRSNSCRRTYWFWFGNLASKPSVGWTYKPRICERSLSTKTKSRSRRSQGRDEHIPAGQGLVLAYIRWYGGMLTCNELEGFSHKFIIIRHGESSGPVYFWFFRFVQFIVAEWCETMRLWNLATHIRSA